MALSFQAVQKAYKVFNELKRSHLPELDIRSWPEDMAEWRSDMARKNPAVLTVYGWGKKSDDGWENLFFLVQDPSDELKAAFDDLKKSVPNSSISGPYNLNRAYWQFGWF